VEEEEEEEEEDDDDDDLNNCKFNTESDETVMWEYVAKSSPKKKK